MVAVLATVAVMVIATLLIVVFRAQTIAWIVGIPLAFIFIEGAPLLVFSLKASVPYSRERKLGYTTGLLAVGNSYGRCRRWEHYGRRASVRTGSGI